MYVHFQVTKDLQKEGHPRRLQSSAGQHQALIMQPLVVQHFAQNVHTEVQLGLAPPLSGGGSTGGSSGGGFFGSVSIRNECVLQKNKRKLPIFD